LATSQVVKQACVLEGAPYLVTTPCGVCARRGVKRGSLGATISAGPGPAFACHSSKPQAVFAIGCGGGWVSPGATLPSRRSTTWSPGSSPQSCALQVNPSPDFEHDHAEAGQYLDPRVIRASGKSDPGGSVMC
jgi:hypothetical protein